MLCACRACQRRRRRRRQRCRPRPHMSLNIFISHACGSQRIQHGLLQENRTRSLVTRSHRRGAELMSECSTFARRSAQLFSAWRAARRFVDYSRAVARVSVAVLTCSGTAGTVGSARTLAHSVCGNYITFGAPGQSHPQNRHRPLAQCRPQSHMSAGAGDVCACVRACVPACILRAACVDTQQRDEIVLGTPRVHTHARTHAHTHALRLHEPQQTAEETMKIFNEVVLVPGGVSKHTRKRWRGVHSRQQHVNTGAGHHCPDWIPNRMELLHIFV